MKYLARLLLALTLLASPALAQQKPLVVIGGQTKQLPAGTTLGTQASTTGAASLNIPQGVAPTSPNNGDIWTTSAGVYVRAGGTTIGPLSPGVPVNPVWFGCDPTGAADCTTAVTSAYAVSNYIKFPPGKFRFNSAKTFTVSGALGSMKIEGSGADVTTLYFPTTGGWTFQLSSQGQSVHLEDFSITTGGANNGNAITIQNSAAFLGTFVAQSDITRVTCRGDDGYGVNQYWSTCFNIVATTDVTFDGVNAYGDSTALHGTGISIAAPSGGAGVNCISGSPVCATTFLISKSNFSFLGVGISLGTNTQSVSVDTSFIAQVQNGIVVQSTARTLQGLNITNLHCFATERCLYALSSQPNLQVIGGYMNVATGGRYAIDVPSSQMTLTGITFFPRTTPNPAGSGAIHITAATNTCGTTGTATCAGPASINNNSYTSIGTATLIDATVGMVNVGSGNTYNSNTATVTDNGTGNLVGALIADPFGKVGFSSGSGGTVTQLTNKSTGVTLNTRTGSITTNNAALGAAAEVAFTLTNSKIGANDIILAQTGNGNYDVRVTDRVAGSCIVRLKNTTGGSLSDAVVIDFVVISGANN